MPGPAPRDPERFSEVDLIAHVLADARPSAALRALAAQLAGRSLHERGSFGRISLASRPGSAPQRAARLAALWEFAERQSSDDRPSVCSPRDVLLLLEPLRHARREHVMVVLLDARHRLISLETVAVGTLNSSRLHARDVFGPALRAEAVAVIAGHNHPSGDPSPSRADRIVTASLRAAGELLGVPLLDHLVIARHGHHSFRDAEAWDVSDAA